uniref:Uncharacterized protein n=1 Tax=Plectus sambesii TaxID=2011161 RepID=A0A914XKG0_9BILA
MFKFKSTPIDPGVNPDFNPDPVPDPDFLKTPTPTFEINPVPDPDFSKTPTPVGHFNPSVHTYFASRLHKVYCYLWTDQTPKCDFGRKDQVDFRTDNNDCEAFVVCRLDCYDDDLLNGVSMLLWPKRIEAYNGMPFWLVHSRNYRKR